MVVDQRLSEMAVVTPVAADKVYLLDGTESRAATVASLAAVEHDTSTITGDLTIGGNIVGNGSGMTITGGNADGETLTVVSNSVDPENDTVEFGSPLGIFHDDITFDQGTIPPPAVDIGNGATWTIDTVVSAVFAISFRPTIVYDVDAFALVPTFLFDAQPAIEAGAGVTTFGTIMILNSSPIMDAVDETVTGTQMVSLQHQPTFSASGTGSHAIVNDRALTVVGVVAAGATVARRIGVEAAPYSAQAGTLTDQAAFVANFSPSQASGDTTQVLIGTGTIPSGEWGIYNTSADNNFIEGDIYLSTDTGPRIQVGTGDPDTVVTAAQGSIFIRTDGGAGTTIYANDDGSTSWHAL